MGENHVWYVIEVQSSGDSGATIANTYPTQEEAESKFHLILSAAAISSVPRHGAILFSDTMDGIMTKVYNHPVLNNVEEEQ